MKEREGKGRIPQNMDGKAWPGWQEQKRRRMAEGEEKRRGRPRRTNERRSEEEIQNGKSKKELEGHHLK